MTEGTRLLGGRYALGEVIGYGGMAEVHRGSDQRLGRDVAVKVLRADLARDAGFQARFRREAQNAASLNHPAIVAVFDTGEENGADSALPYIVMEYVEGRTLKDVLAAEHRLMPERALEIAGDVCAALDFSHRHGIVHRDIKPANVMLTPAGTVKVMDFGIARAVASGTSTMTQTSAVIGTAQYLSPEQARGESVDARSDVYSTGCLLYELLVGRPPFTGDNPVSVAYQHVREDPVPPGELNADVTPTIDAIVLKAMAKNPANRYQTAGEMRADLQRAVAGQPVSATPLLSARERGGDDLPVGAGATAAVRTQERRPRRSGVLYAALALVAVIVLALTALGTSRVVTNGSREVTMPNLSGRTQQQALDDLRRLDLRARTLTINTTTDSNKGQVVAQNPAADTTVEQGTEVVVTVSAGLARVTVPNIVGYNQSGAEQQLAQLELKVRIDPQDSSERAGAVLGLSPAAGSSVPVGSVITVEVSRGNVLQVPNVRGQTRADAEKDLKAVDLKVKVVLQERPQDPPGTVVEQDPPPDSRRTRGTTVTIVVAVRPSPSPSPTPSIPVTPTPTPSPTPPAA